MYSLCGHYDVISKDSSLLLFQLLFVFLSASNPKMWLELSFYVPSLAVLPFFLNDKRLHVYMCGVLG